QFMQFLTGPNLGTQPVQFVVLREGQQQTLVLQPNAITQGIVAHDPYYQYGMIIDDNNPNQIVVQRVFPRTPAYYAGLRQGDVIPTRGGREIATLTAFTQGRTQAMGPVALQSPRAGQTRDVQLDPSLAADSSVRTALRPNLDGAAGVSTPNSPVAAPPADARA